ncbi:Zinc finger MYM-type protein 6 [Plecturocebus cupreus]
MYMPLTHVCSLSSVRRWTQSTHIFSYTQKWDGFLKSPLTTHFSDIEWVTKLAYLWDIVNLLNKINISLQRKMATVFKLADKVASFKAKMEL